MDYTIKNSDHTVRTVRILYFKTEIEILMRKDYLFLVNQSLYNAIKWVFYTTI